MPGGGGPGTEDGSAGLPDLLHAGGLPEYAGCLPLPREQGKAGPTFLLRTPNRLNQRAKSWEKGCQPCLYARLCDIRQ